ncbi:2-hydroxy-3-oxopropionate reductase [Desulfosporosinus sp. BICA1-9]|uniref:2-hydroxy-3-oxopropionate reductase n=1 Tax=Desulfosporosinus sp. BICA1-9 TaxID=1531958 RepID=UPI000B07900B|nr:2-hydroxy-3-oxopropionate reductase [Desulfosporosinus sp. BICA1-9]HBW37837.1 2-hydroxy-3-oxopropionate reductase [Desulfosporosinus sp.]
MSKIGFIGLGIMGKPMSRNLIKAGYEVVVYNRSTKAIQEIVEAGAKAGVSPKDVAEQCEIIITMLPNSPQVREVILGPNGVLEGIHPGSIVIDMSSIAPIVSREIAEVLAGKSVRFLDAPVSGGEPKAIEGTLSIMVGGMLADFEECYPIFQAMGSSALLCGDVGAGNVTKLANQIIVAVNIAAVSEALVLATKAGVNPEAVYKAIRGGLAGSTVLDAKAPLMIERRFDPGFRIGLHIKDLNNVLETGHEIGSPLPLTASVMEMMQVLKAQGLEQADHGALVQYYEKLAQSEVSRG